VGDTLLMLYDADCGLCSRTAQALRILDRGHRLRLVPLQRAALVLGEAAPPESTLAAVLHVRDSRGEWWLGGAAGIKIGLSIPMLWLLAQAFRLPVLNALVEPMYEYVVTNRDALGRLVGASRCHYSGDVDG
jgi:predicted DCC family thiol-disulfide oxidoreductase YuxK